MIDQGNEQMQEETTDAEPASEAAAGPKFIYFYYIRRPPVHRHGSGDGSDPSRLAAVGDEQSDSDETHHHQHGELRVYFVPNERGAKLDDQRIRDLVARADSGALSPVGFAVNDLTLRHRGYMLFVWREAGRALEDVTFVWQDDANRKNHSFTGFTKMVPSGEFSGVHCINSRVRHDGGPLGGRTETFDVEFMTNPLMAWIHNEVATNTGP
jgi:hypothetical protein